MEDQEAAARAKPTPEPLPEPDPVRPNVARVYDYLLGGKDNYAVDRALGDQIIAGVPTVQVGVRAQRELLGRVVRYLVAEQGVRQLIDIGSGLPTADRADPGADSSPVWGSETGRARAGSGPGLAARSADARRQ